jgi:hypothetical protein
MAFLYNFLSVKFDVGQICILYRKCTAVATEGGIKQCVRNNKNDDDGFEYLRNWLIFVVTVASCILCVANGRKINSLSGNFLTKMIIFCFK